MLEFRILGPFEVVRQNRPLLLGGPKQRALLAVLLLARGEVVSIDRVIDQLWGERPPERAVKTAQVYVSNLRKALGDGRLMTRGRGYALAVDPGQLDLERFEALVASGGGALQGGDARRASRQLREALALWRGPPLADFAYEPFAQGEIARLEEARMACLEERIDADLALGDHVRLVSELELLVHEHPQRERLRAQRMLALYRGGRQAEALEAYHEARRILIDQLGIEPSRELRELHQSIVEQDPRLELRSEVHIQAPRDARASAAFVGRERELSELADAFEDAVAGQGRLFVLTGEPGIGKSRLADELARHARARGAQVHVGRCWEAGGAPAFWPWVQSLRSYVRARDREDVVAALCSGAAEIAAILPEVHELIPGLAQPAAPQSEGARFRLFSAIAEFLRRASEQHPLVLILDDLHAADAPSMLLLQFLARELGSMHVLLLAAVRDVDPTPGEALTAMLAEVAREPVTRRAWLTGLSEDDVAAYVQLTAAEIASFELVQALYYETGGNPLFVSETVRLLALEGTPPQSSGTPRLTIPQTVSEVISRRLAHLSPDCNQILIQASVHGREFGLNTLERVCGEPKQGFLEGIDEATAARVIVEVPGGAGRLRFSHGQVRDTLYDQLGPARRARLHRRVGETLEALYARDAGPHLAELAHHFLEASATGEPNKAIEYARAAAERAARALAYEEAVRLYRMALQALDRNQAPDVVLRGEVLLSLGDAQTRAGDTPGAKETFLLAAGLARDGGTAVQLARAALGFGGRFVHDVGRDDSRLLALLEEALVTLGRDERELRIRLLARLAAGPLRADRARERRASLSEQAVDEARHVGDPALLAYALEARYLAIWAADNAPERLEIATEAVRLSKEAGDPERLLQAHAHRVWALLELGDLAAVSAELDVASALADELRQPAQLWMVAVGRAICTLLAGKFGEAEELIERAFRIGECTVPWNAAVTHDLERFVLRREQGRLDELEIIIKRAADEHQTYPVWRCVLVALYAELGRHGQARTEFERLAAYDFADLPFNEEWLFGMTLLADACAALDDARHANTLYELLLPYAGLSAVGQPEVSLGAIDRALGNLAATTGRFQQAARHFETAIELNRRMGAHPWSAHARHDYARMLIARGNHQTAQHQLAQALATYRELGMSSWADRAQALKRSGERAGRARFHNRGRL